MSDNPHRLPGEPPMGAARRRLLDELTEDALVDFRELVGRALEEPGVTLDAAEARALRQLRGRAR